MSNRDKIKQHQKNLKLLARADDLVDAGQHQEAIGVFSSIIATDHRFVRALNGRGMAHLELGNDQAAIKDLKATLRIDSNFPGARDWLARLEEKHGNSAAAAKNRLRDLRANPNGPHEGMGVSPQDWADCAGSFLKSGDKAKARELLEEYFAEHEAKVSQYKVYATAPMRMLAGLLLEAGEVERALQLTQRAVNHEHGNPGDQEMHAFVLLKQGRIEEAAAIHQQLVKGLPPGNDYMADLGQAIQDAQRGR